MAPDRFPEKMTNHTLSFCPSCYCNLSGPISILSALSRGSKRGEAGRPLHMCIVMFVSSHPKVSLEKANEGVVICFLECTVGAQ